jgi:predicted phage tail component-like protein
LRSFTFNGERKNNIFILKGKKFPVLAPKSHQLLEVPKRPGALLMSTSTKIREIELPIAIKNENSVPFPKLKEEIAQWLSGTEEPSPLILDEDPDRTYFALLDNIEPLEEINKTIATTIIRFICPDPYKYSGEKSIYMPSKSSPSVYDIENLGNLDTHPVVKVNVKKDLHFFSLITDDDYFQIGADIPVDKNSFNTNELILNDSMSSMTGWGQAGYVDNGYLAGEIRSDGSGLYPHLFGDGIFPAKWQGPSMKKSIGSPLQDFRMDVMVELFNKGYKTGMLEVYLLNSSNQTVAKIGIEDYFQTIEKIRAKVRIGAVEDDNWILSQGADKDDYWNNFKGILRLSRIGKHWTAYISTINSKGMHTYPLGSKGNIGYFDTEGLYQDPVTQVQIAFRMYPGTTRAEMKVNDLKIFKITKPPSIDDIPIFAKQGDVLEIDHYQNTIKKNGELLLGYKDFRSNFFTLKTGKNPITMLPSDAGDVTLSFRERYL